MKEINVCPSTLQEGFGSYSPKAAKRLFDGKIPDDSIFALSRGLFSGTDQHKELNMTTGGTFLAFGKTIGLPARLAKKEWTRFCKEYPLIEQLVENSFLSEELKRTYLDKYNFRRRRLAAIFGD